jgi:hypothetical protein
MSWRSAGDQQLTEAEKQELRVTHPAKRKKLFPTLEDLERMVIDIEVYNAML